MTGETRREPCPACGNLAPVRPDGQLGKHRRQLPGRLEMVPCPNRIPEAK